MGSGRATTWPAWGIVVLTVLVFILIAPFREPDSPLSERLYRPYLLPLPLLGLLLFMFQVLRRGDERAPLTVLLAGVAFIAGGVGFDVLATALHSPDLAQESNPVARTLLDSGHSVLFVCVYGVVMQGGGALFLCLLWAAFLRHRRAPWSFPLAVVWLGVPWAFGEGLFRWYLGLAWFRVVPALDSPDIVPITAKVTALGVYLIWSFGF